MPSTPSNHGSSASYRSIVRLGPDPVTEADVITELMLLTTALRRKLLMVTIAASFGGGFGVLALYVSAATEIYGRVCGGAFAVGAIATFALGHRVSGLLARRWEARWIAEFAGRHALAPGPLVEALGMFKS
jgi:hypothetical protein